jgi:alanine-glyoxylate transaminase/serine-glyoxylate transaminase/serine-pyruvate transaminase
MSMNRFDGKKSAIPGGVSLHPGVQRNMHRSYVNPWSEEFLNVFDDTLNLLKRLYDTQDDVLVMIGPIRMAMDSVICSLLEPGETTAAILANGYWSELFEVIAKAHGMEPLVIKEKWGNPIDPKKVQLELDSARNKNIKFLFATHVETSTGIVNPIQELGRIAKERGLFFIVDAAQSLGGMGMHVDSWGIDFCLSGNHKCMSAPAGLNYIAISKQGWEAVEKRKNSIKGWYTSLLVWREVWMKRQPGYFTFPTSLLFGLRAALDIMFDMGLSELYRRYDVVARSIRQGVIEMGSLPLPACECCPGCNSSERICANTVTAIKYPTGIQHEDFARLMHYDYNLTIAGTYGAYMGKAFRVGPTGLEQIQRDFPLHLLNCMGLAFKRLGINVNLDKALTLSDAILSKY